MKTLIASLFALSLVGATAANAEDVGIHVGHGHVAIVTHHHHRTCAGWGWRHGHHNRYCRRWR